MSKFCPIHGTDEYPHLVDYCTCAKMSAFPINLIGELLIVRTETPTGTVRLPDWKRSLSGEVISIGPRVLEVRSGDRVSFGAAVGMDSVYSGQEVRILKEKDLDFVYE